MHYAKSMYLGGIIVEANEKRTYTDYKDLGLRCVVCGEVVVFKKGKVRKPYFAHHPESKNTTKECSLRRSPDSNVSPTLSMLNSEGKGQRIELYRQHLLNIISQQHYNFYKIAQDTIFKLTDDKLFNFCQSFVSNKIKILNDLKIDSTQYSKSQILATREVIDYITANDSSNHVLKKLIAYSIYQTYPDSLDSIDSKNNNIIFNEVVNLLLETDWLKFLESYIEYPKNRKNMTNEKTTIKEHKEFKLQLTETKILQTEIVEKSQLELLEEKYSGKKISRFFLHNPGKATFEYTVKKKDKKGQIKTHSNLRILIGFYSDYETESMIFPVYIPSTSKVYELGFIKIDPYFNLDINIKARALRLKDKWLIDYNPINDKTFNLSHLSNYKQLLFYTLFRKLENKPYLFFSHIEDYRVIILESYFQFLDNNQDNFYIDGVSVEQSKLNNDDKLTILNNAYNKTKRLLGDLVDQTTVGRLKQSLKQSN